MIASRLGRGPRRSTSIAARPRSVILAGVAFFVAYLALGDMSYSFVLAPGRSALFWLPSGLTLAAFLRADPAAWPVLCAGILLAEAVSVSLHGSPLAVALVWGCANSIMPLVGAWLLRSPGGRRFELRRLGDVVRLVSLGALVGALPGALVAAAASVTWTGRGPYWHVVAMWWSSDVLGVLLVCPLLLAWTERAPPMRARAREALVLFAALVGLAWFVFGGAQPRELDAALPPLLLPVTAWAAIRFGTRGATAATVLLDLLVVWFTIHGRGPFAMVDTSVAARILSAQTYVVSLSLFALLLAVVVTEEREARAVAEQAEWRSKLIASASAALSGSLDWAETIAALPKLCVRTLADWCVIDVIEGGHIRRCGGAHRYPSKEGLLRDLVDCYTPQRSSPALIDMVVGRGEPLLLPDVTDEILRHYCTDDEHARLLRALGFDSAMVVPLSVRGQTIGVLTLGAAVPARRFGSADLELTIEIAGRAAIAIDNARLYRDAQDAIRLRDEFLSIASHELNTPITSLQLTIQGLRRGPARAASTLATSLARAERQVEKLARLVGELLDVSRISGGRMFVQLEDVDLLAVVRGVVERCAGELGGGICNVKVSADRPVIGRWDPLRLEQVVTSLISNALKFSEGGTIDISVGEEGGRAWLVVRDQGIGIPAERLPYIFERFERAVSARSYGGLGLGLYIARAIVEALGGSIRAESMSGGGAIFTVELPCAGPPPHPPG